MKRNLSHSALAAIVVAAALSTQCGNGPTQAGEPAPLPTPEPVVQAPVPVVGCGLPKGPGSGEDCPRWPGPAFLGQVDQAINKVIAEHPDWFDFHNARGDGGFWTYDQHRFTAEVQKNLELAGFCTVFDGHEIAVKRTNDFSDQYDVVHSHGFLRRGDPSYRATCTPAWF